MVGCTQDANTVLVGHSSGAVAAMRLLEKTPLLGAVLVSACHTDLGDAGERACAPHALPTFPPCRHDPLVGEQRCD